MRVCSSYLELWSGGERLIIGAVYLTENQYWYEVFSYIGYRRNQYNIFRTYWCRQYIEDILAFGGDFFCIVLAIYICFVEPGINCTLKEKNPPTHDETLKKTYIGTESQRLVNSIGQNI